MVCCPDDGKIMTPSDEGGIIDVLVDMVSLGREERTDQLACLGYSVSCFTSDENRIFCQDTDLR